MSAGIDCGPNGRRPVRRVDGGGSWLGRGGDTVAELWDLGNEQWSRDAATGRFEVVSFRGQGPPSSQWLAADIGRLVGARFGRISSPAEAEIFPSGFARSPLTGAALTPATPTDPRAWLPPYGENEPTEIGFLGLARTAAGMVLDLDRYSPEETADLSRDVGLEPADTLPLPDVGSYFFALGRFGCVAPTLVAIEYSKGLLFAWAPGSRAWVELVAKDEALPECSLAREAWGAQIVLLREHESWSLVLPTDAGLAVVSLNLLALSYSVRLIDGRCIGAPLLIGDSVATPVTTTTGVQQLLLLNKRNPTDIRRWDLPPPLLGAPGLGFRKAFADRRVAVWLSSAGQLVCRPVEAADRNRLSFVPWPTNMEPRFEFGAPYLSTTGRLWQLSRNMQSGAYQYVQLCHANPEVQPVQSPRLSTGGTVFHLESQLRGEPWQDSESEDASASELLIPLLESVLSKSVLRVRVAEGGSMSTARLLTSPERYRVLFELEGVRNGQPSTTRFHGAQMSRPWLTEAFLFEDRLYLYHPDISSGIPGWTLRQEK